MTSNCATSRRELGQEPEQELGRVRNRSFLAALAVLGLTFSVSSLGCGGDEKKVEEPERVVPDEPEEPDPSEGMVEPEILEAIQRTFARKQTILGRCFVEGVNAGEMQKTARGFITVGATITPAGRAKKVRVLKASLTSKTLQTCVIGMVETWEFVEPPRDVETSFMYTMERL